MMEEPCTRALCNTQACVLVPQETWQGTSASFGTDHIENVLCACFVPAMHYMAAPGDSCILTGFASGQVGHVWIS